MDIEDKIDDIINSNLSKHDKLASILRLIIDEADIKPNSYFILGSYALRNNRTISDLDINMDSDEFEKLKELPFGTVEPYNNQTRWFYDLTKQYQKIDPNATDFSIEVFKKRPNEGFPDSDYSLGHLKKTGGLDVDKYDHQYFSMETLLAWKKKMNRPKDQDDIKLIESIMVGGGLYYQKYKKYKLKYMRLKNEMRV